MLEQGTKYTLADIITRLPLDEAGKAKTPREWIYLLAQLSSLVEEKEEGDELREREAVSEG